MIEPTSPPRPEPSFARRTAIWVVLLLAVYLAYSATHFWGRPDAVADFLVMVVGRLPLMAVQILPPAVFAGALGGCGIFGGDSADAPRRPWILLAMLALTAYALPALVWPAFAQWTGADRAFPAALIDSVRSDQAAAEAATGNVAARHLRRAANDLGTLVVPIANAALVVLAAALGDLTGRMTGGLSTWTRYATRWLSGGLLFAAFWIPVSMANELVGYQVAWGGLLFVFPLFVPTVAAGILFAYLRPDRGPAR